MGKKSGKTARGLLLFGVVLLLSIAGLFFFSPYGSMPGYSYKLISTKIAIQAPTDVVFKYLGNSANASQWSTFVDHIIPLNSDKFPDGKPGSIRRCFCQPNEKDMRWDELITQAIPDKKRQLLIYNMQEFPITADGLATEQLYYPINYHSTRLTFTVFFKDHEPTVFETIKMYLSAYYIDHIFEANLNQIRILVEEEYQTQSGADIGQIQ
jgi:hypothetical protein